MWKEHHEREKIRKSMNLLLGTWLLGYVEGKDTQLLGNLLLGYSATRRNKELCYLMTFYLIHEYYNMLSLPKLKSL